jgi:hypothetical protein
MDFTPSVVFAKVQEKQRKIQKEQEERDNKNRAQIKQSLTDYLTKVIPKLDKLEHEFNITSVCVVSNNRDVIDVAYNEFCNILEEWNKNDTQKRYYYFPSRSIDDKRIFYFDIQERTETNPYC